MKQNKLQNYLSVVSKLVIQVEICNRVSHDNMTILILAFSLKYNSRSFVPSTNTFRQSNYLMFWPQPMLMFNNFCWDIDRLPLFIFLQFNMRIVTCHMKKIILMIYFPTVTSPGRNGSPPSFFIEQFPYV